MSATDIDNDELATRVEALREAVDRLRPHLRPAPVGAAALPWRADPAVVALETLPPASRTRAIEALLADAHPLVCAVGVHLAIEAGDVAALEGCVARLERIDSEDDEVLAAMIVAAIGRLGARRHVALLRAALDRPATFWAAVESLAQLGGEGVLADLERAIARHEDAWDRLDVVMIVGAVGGAFAAPVLTRILLDSREPFVPLRGYAAQALGARGEHTAVEPLLAALADPSMTEKGRVLWGLAQLGAPQTWDAIEPWLWDAQKPWWRAEALKALVACDAERARPLVLGLVREDPFFRSDREAFADLVRALGRIDAPDARAVLTEVLRAVRGLAPAGLVESLSLPSWLGQAGARLAVVVLTAIGEGLGVDLTPRTSDRYTTDALVEALRERLARAIAERGLEVPAALVEALAAGSDG